MSWYVDQDGQQVWIPRDEMVYTVMQLPEQLPLETLTYLSLNKQKDVFQEHLMDESADSASRLKKKDREKLKGQQRGYIVRVEHDEKSRVVPWFKNAASRLVDDGIVSRIDADEATNMKKKKKADQFRSVTLMGANECRIETTARCYHFAHGPGFQVEVAEGVVQQKIHFFTNRRILPPADWHAHLLAALEATGVHVMLTRRTHGEAKAHANTPKGSTDAELVEDAESDQRGRLRKGRAQVDEDTWFQSVMMGGSEPAMLDTGTSACPSASSMPVGSTAGEADTIVASAPAVISGVGRFDCLKPGTDGNTSSVKSSGKKAEHDKAAGNCKAVGGNSKPGDPSVHVHHVIGEPSVRIHRGNAGPAVRRTGHNEKSVDKHQLNSGVTGHGAQSMGRSADWASGKKIDVQQLFAARNHEEHGIGTVWETKIQQRHEVLSAHLRSPPASGGSWTWSAWSPSNLCDNSCPSTGSQGDGWNESSWRQHHSRWSAGESWNSWSHWNSWEPEVQQELAVELEPSPSSQASVFVGRKRWERAKHHSDTSCGECGRGRPLKLFVDPVDGGSYCRMCWIDCYGDEPP